MLTAEIKQHGESFFVAMTDPQTMLPALPDEIDYAGAYGIQREVVKRKVKAGYRQIGFKVGCTSEATQEQLEISHPVFGRVFDLPENKRLSTNLSDYRDLGLEGELAVILKVDPRILPTAKLEIEDAILSIFPVIEFHTCIETYGRDPRPHYTIASNALHVGLLKPEDHPQNPDPTSLGMTIKINGQVEAELSADDLRNHMLDSLSWLSSKLAIREGWREDTKNLNKECVVLCGTQAPLFPIETPSSFEVTTPSHGSVSCVIS